MTRPIPEPKPMDPGAAVLIDRVREQLVSQTWYERFSNTVTSAAGTVLLGLWALVNLGVDIPESVTTPIYVGLGLLTTFGVFRTTNGTTPAEVHKLETLAPSGPQPPHA